MTFRILFILLLFLGLPLSASADLTLGVAPRSNSSIQTEQQAIRMAAALKKQLGEGVRVRIFDDEATLHAWLNRHQLVDIAIFTRGYVSRQSPGEFLLLRGTEGFLAQDALVLRQGITQQLARRLQASVPALATDLALRPLPGKAVPEFKAAGEAGPPDKPKARPRIRPVREKAPIAPVAPPEVAPPVAKPEPPPAPAIAPAPSPPAAVPTEPSAAGPSPAPAAPASEGPTTTVDLPTPAETAPPAPETDAASPYSRSNPAAEPAAPDTASAPEEESGSATMTILLLLAALLAAFLFWRRRSQAAGHQPEPEPSPEPPTPRSKSSIISAALNKVYEREPPPRRDAEPKDHLEFDFADMEEPPAKIDARAPSTLAETPDRAFTTSEDEAIEESWFSTGSRPAPPHWSDEPEPETFETVAEIVTVADARNAETEPPAPAIPEAAEPFDLETPQEPEAVVSVTEVPEEPEEEEPWFVTDEAPPLADETAPVDEKPEDEKLFVDPNEEGNPFADNSLLSSDYEEVAPVNAPPVEDVLWDAAEPETVAGAGEPDEPSDEPAEWLESLESAASAELDRQPPEPPQAMDEDAPDVREWAAPAEPSGEPPFAVDHAGVSAPSELDEEDVFILQSGQNGDADIMQLTSEEIAVPEERLTLEPFATQDEPAKREESDRYPPPAAEPRDETPVVFHNSELPSWLETDAGALGPRREVAEAMAPDTPKSKARAALPLRINGELGASQLPALLKLIAGQRSSGTLLVRSRLAEKRIYFRKGKIAGVTSNTRGKGTGSKFLMSKLGELLIRQGRITEAERDHALKICSLQPSRRIGEVLFETCNLTQVELKHTLRLQAEEILFSLILFPGGGFEYATGPIPIAPEEDMLIDVNVLIQEASRQANEWRELRKTIPSLNTVMEIKVDSHKKLHNARLAPQQDMILSMVDGQRSIYEICKLTGVLELEVYKFLYLMTKARIVSPISTESSATPAGSH